MTAGEFFHAGRLAEAVSAATDSVKRKPMEADARWLLAELLCFQGELERADKQLDVITQQDPGTVPAVARFRQLIRGAQFRREVFHDGRAPEAVGAPGESLQTILRAALAFRGGDFAESRDLLAKDAQTRSAVPGSCDGEAFDDIRDLDDLLAPLLEVFTNTGKYYWIPFEHIALLELHPPERPRDLIWRPAHLVVSGGPDGEVFLPCLYDDTHGCDDEGLLLGRATDWKETADGIVRGVGQKMFLMGDAERSILECTTIEFTTPRAITAAPV